MRLGIVLQIFKSTAFSEHSETVLYDRLFNGYELEFNPGPDCPLSKRHGRQIFENDKFDQEKVPDVCVKYGKAPTYNKNVRPVVKHESAVQLGMGITLLQIMELNERQQYLTMSVMHEFVWNDEYMRWRPSMHGNIKSIIVPAKMLWTPDVFLYQSVENEFDSKYQSNIEVSYDGTCMWLPPAVLKSSCDVDMSFFPFDTQTCSLKFGSWSYTKEHVNLTHLHPTNSISGQGQTGQLSIDENQYISNSEWNITSRVSVLNEIKYDCCPAKYVDITYNIELQRFIYYPALTLVLPCIITSVLVVLTFVLPPEAGEKIGLNITVLLAMIVFMDQMNQETPPMSNRLPVIGQFFVSAMVIISFSLVSTIACLRLYHTSGQVDMSCFFEYLFLKFLPSILFATYPPPKKETIDYETDDSKNEEILSRRSSYKGTSDLFLIYRELKIISDGFRDTEKTAKNEEKWKYAAYILDRLCAWFFMFALFGAFMLTIGSTPGLFKSR